MRAVGYVRVSTREQSERGFGLDVQRDAIRAWAKHSGHRVVAIHEDKGVSGSNGVDDREGLPAALEDIRDGRAEAMCVHRLDRVARSLTVQEAALAKVWQLGGRVFTAESGEVLPDDPDDPMRTAMRQVIGVFSELERRMITKRMRGGRERKRASGGYAGHGSPRFGFVSLDKELTPDEREQATIRRAVELHRAGTSLRAIADVLDAEGHAPKRGQRWHPQTVARVLERAT